MNPSSPTVKEQVADHIIKYANLHGMWPTIEFIVNRWIEMNKEGFSELQKTIAEEKSLLQNRFGNNEETRKGNMPMKRALEVPEEIWTVINILFSVEKKEYKGGEKEFWREFGRKYPAFKIGE